jgi:hypothetical protein
VSEAQLDGVEKRELADTLDGLCHDRISAVWKATLDKAQDAFKVELSGFLSSLEERIERESFNPRPPPSAADLDVTISANALPRSAATDLLPNIEAT